MEPSGRLVFAMVAGAAALAVILGAARESAARSYSQAPAEVAAVRAIHAALEDLSKRTDGVGGYYFDTETGRLEVYPANGVSAPEIEVAVAGALRSLVPSSGLLLVEPLLSYWDLGAWRSDADDAVFQLAGVFSGGLDQVRERIAYSVQTEHVAHQARVALARAGVPQAAVVFDVAPKYEPAAPPSRPASPPGAPFSLTLELGVERALRMGGALAIDVVIRNDGDGAAVFEHRGACDGNVIVFTTSGEQVWVETSAAAPIVWPVHCPGPLEAELAPGEELRRTVLWDLRDEDGFELRPGSYLVRAVATVRHLGYGALELSTPAHELIVLPR